MPNELARVEKGRTTGSDNEMKGHAMRAPGTSEMLWRAALSSPPDLDIDR